MKRIKDTFLDTLESVLPLRDKNILEIGCGNGSRTVQIAERCLGVIAIDPDDHLIHQAQRDNPRPGVTYMLGSADSLPFQNNSFDLLFFTLSFHHVPIPLMAKAIDEAIRVVKTAGTLVFLEPTFHGTFFEAELRFNACDGDERKEKAQAYATMLSHPNLKEIVELQDETVFQFASVEDFIQSLSPKNEERSAIDVFLKSYNYILNAERRINIFQPCVA